MPADVRLLDVLKKIVDPTLPIGEVLSPSDVYKERLGLPIQAPHTQRVRLEQNAYADRAIAAQPTRFVSLEDGRAQVPKDRVRQVSAFVEEHWSPVYRKTDSTDLATILLTSQEQIGWSVTQRKSQSSRARHHNHDEQVEVLQSVQIQASDRFYDGYYETVPGNDPLILDGQVMKGQATFDKDGKMTHDGTVRGGTQIRGRTEYNRKTKGMVHMDAGFFAEKQRQEAEMASRPIRNVAQALEAKKGEALPMRRLLANPRYDRHSAC